MYWEEWTETKPDIVVSGKMAIDIGIDFYDGYIDITTFSETTMSSGTLINNDEALELASEIMRRIVK
jgi:hypothetical protein